MPALHASTAPMPMGTREPGTKLASESPQSYPVALIILASDSYMRPLLQMIANP